MKRNIFILRTQYNLIMGYAVMSTFSEEDENDIIVQPEFNLSQELRESLSKNFSRVLILDKANGVTPFEKAKELTISLGKCKEFLKSGYIYDRLIFAQERPLETMLFSNIYSMNNEVSIESVEEDAYYSLNNYFNIESNQKDWIKRGGLRSFSEKLFFKLIQLRYWKDTFMYPSYAYGMHPKNAVAHVQYPKYIRDELSEKKIIPVTADEIKYGINMLYGEIHIDYPENDTYLLMFFDLMERYKNPDLIKKIVTNFIQEATASGISILVKYHPRETNKFVGLGDLNEIDCTIPAEKVLLDLADKNVTVLCNATTVGLVAAKVGMKVISTAKIDLVDNTALHRVWEALGIKMLNSNDFN